METFDRNELTTTCKLLYNEMYSYVLKELDTLEHEVNNLCAVETKYLKIVSRIKKIPFIGELLIKKLES